MASQSETVRKVQKINKILQINLETGEEHYEVQTESVDLIELLDDETNENNTEVEENDNVNETLFLEKTQSLPKRTPIKTLQPSSGDSFLDKTESWSQSFCKETPEPSPEPASLDDTETFTFFQNKTQSLTRSHSNGILELSPVSGLLEDTLTLSGNKTGSAGSYLTSTPARSCRLAQEVTSCGESFNNNAFPKSPILEYSHSSLAQEVASCGETFNNNAFPKSPILEYSSSSPHPSEAHRSTIIEECPPSTSRDDHNLSLAKRCRASRGLSLSSNSGILDVNTEIPSQEMSLDPVYGKPGERGEMSSQVGQIIELGQMSSQVGQIIDQEKFASCPICYKSFFKDDLPLHASGCEGEEDGFVGMSEGFLCGYCLVHIKDDDEEMEEHLLMCKAVKAKERAEAERRGRKKTLRKGSVSKTVQYHKDVPDKRNEKSKETKTVGRSNSRRSAALVSGIQPVHRQKRTSNKKCYPRTTNATCTNPSTSRATRTNPSTSSATRTNLSTSSATCTIADDCIPSTSKRILTKTSEISCPVKRNLRGNPCQQENIQRGNSNRINEPTDKRISSVRNPTAPRPNGKARKKARAIFSACPLCFKHWMIEELEVHASGCLGDEQGEEEIILDGTDEEMTDGDDGTERFFCGYCSKYVHEGEDEKENHLISCRKNMVTKKWQEAAREKKNTLRSREKKQV